MNVEPIGRVSSSRSDATDDNWDVVTATITLDVGQFSPEALQGIADFSHVEIVYAFDQVEPAEIETGARHPRGNRDWPSVGIFAQRAKMRPNRLAVSVCRLLEVDGLTLKVEALDAIDGSPVVDVKPYMAEFGPRGDVHQPAWSHELMATYWTNPNGAAG
jgi:tRNA-Thr(GGU) m(6)t(6)A37 methyltransferase TsaA